MPEGIGYRPRSRAQQNAEGRGGLDGEGGLPASRASQNASGRGSFADAFSRRPLEYQEAALAAETSDGAPPLTQNSSVAGDGAIGPPDVFAIEAERRRRHARLRSLSGLSAGLGGPTNSLTSGQFKEAVRRERNDMAVFESLGLG